MDQFPAGAAVRAVPHAHSAETAGLPLPLFIDVQICLYRCLIFLADPVGFGIPVSALPVQSVQFGLTPFLVQAIISNKLPLFFIQIHFVSWAIPVYAKMLWEKESHLQYPILRDASQVNIILTNLLNISVGDFSFLGKSDAAICFISSVAVSLGSAIRALFSSQFTVLLVKSTPYHTSGSNVTPSICPTATCTILSESGASFAKARMSPSLPVATGSFPRTTA